MFILLLAFALRVYRLGAQSLWYDEAVSAQVAAKGLAELTRWTANDIQPPLYYYILSGWTRLAGHGEWALRFVSVVFGVLGVAMIWSLARRLFDRSRAVRLVAPVSALLAAISPLFIYYGQEARMYTQLVFFAALAGYALWRAVGEATRRRWWVVFVFASLAALYTHYFAMFLLLTFAAGLVANWVFTRPSRFSSEASRQAVLPAAVISFGLIAIGYLPWAPTMLTRYQVDASYWQGELKLGEALRHIAISFTTGAPETMLEADAVRWLPWFGLALVVAITGITAASRKREWGPPAYSGRVLAALLMVLVVPTTLVLALAARNPKFNPRYLMLVSPAYLLLLAGGVSAWVSQVRRYGLWANAAAAIIVAPLLITSLLGVRNWYGDPAFTKAQWRELAAYVGEHIHPGERVVLVSGHAAPAWDYYASDIPALRLPDIDVLDVNSVLGFEAGSALDRGLSGSDGAWLVQWQNEIVDPVGFVPYYLDRAGQELPVGRTFWHLGLRHWQLRPGAAYPTEPEPQHVQAANFDHKLALLGWDDPAGGAMTVYWKTLNTLTADYNVSLILEDAQGKEIGRWDGRPAGYDFPTTRWSVGKAIFGRYPLPENAGGQYYVSLGVYGQDAPEGLDIRDVADNPAGKRIRFGPIYLTSK